MPRGEEVEIAGRRLRLSNQDKVLYPEAGFTKGDVVGYYVEIAPTILPHLKSRPISLRRYPDGVDAEGFFSKQRPKGTPEWVPSIELPSPGSTKDRDKVSYLLVEEAAALAWLANLAALELHTPQWQVGPRGGLRDPDLLVFDLDPGPPATIVECCDVALGIRDLLAEDGLAASAMTSGSKGLQLYVPIEPADEDRTTAYAKAAAQILEADRPELVLDQMDREARAGKVFIDWSQNRKGKTTIAPYSLRARPRPTVATPVTWEEIEECASPDDLVFDAPAALKRVEAHGDLMAPLLGDRQRLPRR